jgi:hypothetical protein
MLDDMLVSDGFRESMRRYHSDLLWPTLSGVPLTNAALIIRSFRIGTSDVWALGSQQRRRTFRGGSGQALCGDYEQTEFTPDGRPIPNLVTIGDESIKQEGWVWVEPYWTGPGSAPVKACAFDAQIAATGIQQDCATRRGVADPGCGCGPNLQRCFSNDALNVIQADAKEQLLRLVDDVTIGGQAYSSLITTTRAYENGALSHWRRWLAPLVAPNQTINDGHPTDALLAEAIPFTDREFRAVERSGHHSGILTLPTYLLRFQTNRGRANRFRIAFTGQYFVPSNTPDTEGCDPTSDDLTQRCECRHCHQVLEPLAAHFAPFTEAGSAVVDPAFLPIYDPDCDPTVTGKLGPACARFYVTDPGAYNPGVLLTHQFADIDDPLHKKLSENLENGPLAWSQEIIQSGAFHASIVQSLWLHLTGRDFILDPTDPDTELELLQELAAQFQTDDDFTALVKRMVMTDQYRRVR